MRRLFKKSAALAVALTLALPMVAYAEPVTQDSAISYNAGTTDSNSISSQIMRKQRIDEYIGTIEELDNDIANNTIEIQRNTDKAQQLTQEIKDTDKQIAELQDKMKKDLDASGERIRALSQFTPQMEMLASLFDSGSVSEFLRKTESISRIMKYDSEMFKKAKDNEEELEKLKTKQAEDQDQVYKILAECTKKSEELTAKKAEVADKLEEIKKEYAAAEIANRSSGAVLGYQSADAKALEDKLKLEYKSYVPTSLESQSAYASVSSSAPGIYEAGNLNTKLKFNQKDVIMFSTGLLDIPYVWGGTTLQGFDCSGFTQYVYRHFGVYLPRVSEDQQNVGIEITNPADLQPGDLLFYGNPAHHVTMYVQPGFMIEAPRSGDVVKISTIREYTKAMRVVDWSKVSVK